MKVAIHAVVFGIGTLVWVLGTFLLGLSIVASAWCVQLRPDAKRGNCWIFAASRFYARGGYLLVRRADDVSFLGRWMVPHVMWCPTVSRRMEVEHYSPVKRRASKWMPLQVFWYEGRVRKSERPHPAKEN